MPNVTINGKPYQFEKKMSILKALQSVGIDVPTLCHDERLADVGACRLCLVRVAGSNHPIVSCENDILDGLEIETHTPEIEESREMNLKMLARRYPLSAFQKYPDKPFHRLARQYGLTDKDFAADVNGHLIDDSHPYIHVDMARCVDCYRCVRICDEVQGQYVWQVFDRGRKTRITPNSGTTLRDSSCVSCGACVDTCPTGALEDKSILERGVPTDWTKSVCPYCGTGCEISVGRREQRIVQIKPVNESPVNHGHLCVKGAYAFDFVHADDRVTEPMIREKGGNWRTVSWDEAIGFAARKMKEIVERAGPDAAAVLGSARATNEDNYLAQKFARVCLETNNVDNCARVCHTPSAAALKMMLGAGAATNSFRDIELARTILICGANPTENHPILGSRIKQAVRHNGANLIVIDPRKIELTRFAKIHLQLRPGTNIAMLNAFANVIIEEGLVDEEFIRTRVTDYEKFADFVREYTPERVSEICDVPADLIRRAARMYGGVKPAMCVHGLGTTEHTQGTEGVMGLVNLALLTGNLGKRGTGVNPLRGQNNVQGAAHMGCDPGILTGSIAVEEGRAHFESVWKTTIPSSKGLSQLQMMDAARAEKLKALWVIGYDVFLSNANASETFAAFDKLELVIVQDMFMNETAREFGTVFFPAASSFEKDGTFMNGERRVSRVRKVIEPIGNSRSDWEIICDVARAYGKGEQFEFSSAEEIWNEIRAVWPGSYGITYDRIDSHGLQWNCPDTDHPGTEVLHTDSFVNGVQTSLRRLKYIPTKEVVSEEFPLLLSTGRTLYQFNAGTMTLRTKNRILRPSDLLYVSPKDAAELGVEDAEVVKLESRYGVAELPVKINPTVRDGELFATFHNPEIFLNRITTPLRDRFVHTPEYKVTAVRILKISDL
ncbi:MAG: formate dehydrogenase subunit alpha [Acidobacteria bacterium]|nr:formate dehydrogenase subunit alpha [Acidobacteriota bacterium]